ncbi:uncharacterized protein JN550_004558 [Neoarthrinium moseri]|uniref:uncharacterized protein n=1 Tax=Neoarthrinium moseri TaxID=1658444 RepID=UPI001FDD5DF3|nr:uncharacterized protein JN550_004558 [Neoarthrinium moseri]KAI1871564.1 hypothetical protein JN550_004558 [Neoarthrinium moseri]
MARRSRMLSCLASAALMSSVTGLNVPDRTSSVIAATGTRDATGFLITSAPDRDGIRPRSTTRDTRLCGYISGTAAFPLMCNSDYECRRNTQLSVVGCGDGQELVVTTCYDYGDYLSGKCENQDDNYQFCMTNIFTGPTYEAYTLVDWAAQSSSRNRLVNWDFTTTDTSSSTQSLAPLATVIEITSTTAAPTATATATPNEPKGFSTSNRIALGTGIGIGLPSSVAALVTLWVTIRNRRKTALSHTSGQGITT